MEKTTQADGRSKETFDTTFDRRDPEAVKEEFGTLTVTTEGNERAVHDLIEELNELEDEIEEWKKELFLYREALHEEMILALNKEQTEVAELYRDCTVHADTVLQDLIEREKTDYGITD